MKAGSNSCASACLPLTLLGIGAASWREVKGSQQLLRDQNALGALGISGADRAKVAQLAGEGRMDEAHTALQEAMRNRDPGTARQFLEQAGAKADREAAAFEQQMRQAGLTLSQDGSEYVITNSTGAQARFSSVEEALAAARAHLGAEGIVDGVQDNSAPPRQTSSQQQASDNEFPRVRYKHPRCHSKLRPISIRSEFRPQSMHASLRRNALRSCSSTIATPPLISCSNYVA